MAAVVFSDVAAEDASLRGTLFEGLKFWLAQRVPQRSRFIADIKANGGDVLPLDKQADIRIVDHARKEVIPGTYSYTFIEKSIRNGHLERLEDHVVGPTGTIIRNIGSTTQPAKGSRHQFTQDDDRLLWHWVQDTPQKFGGKDGNEIYKQLEAHNSRHPWQSWRDRWIKQLKGKPRPAFISDRTLLTPPSDHPPPQTDIEMNRNSRVERLPFTDSDKEALLANAESILNILPEYEMAPWEKWAIHREEFGAHSAQEWEDFWEHHVRPTYFKKNLQEKARLRAPKTTKPILNKGNVSPISYKSPTATSDSPSFRCRSPSTTSPPPQSAQEPPNVHIVRSTILRSKQTGEENSSDDADEASDEQQYSPRGLQAGASAYHTNVGGSDLSKRKRDEYEMDVDELPGSSPPNSPLLNPFPSKRQRLKDLSTRLTEIASTPQNSPARGNLRQNSWTVLGSQTETVDVVDDGVSGEDSSLEFESNVPGRRASPTLSSPTRTVPKSLHSTTRTAFQNSTRFIDPEIPPPQEGWDSGDSYKGPESEPDPSIKLMNPVENLGVPETQPVLPDTQALLNGQTQVPDFDIPDPDEGWDFVDIMPSPPPPLSDQQSFLSSQDGDDDVIAQAEWIASQEVLGYSKEDILTALQAATMSVTIAESVLVYMRTQGKGCIPQNQPGVWTKADDKSLSEARDSRTIEMLHRKHGGKACDERWQFLEYDKE